MFRITQETIIFLINKVKNIFPIILLLIFQVTIENKN